MVNMLHDSQLNAESPFLLFASSLWGIGDRVFYL